MLTEPCCSASPTRQAVARSRVQSDATSPSFEELAMVTASCTESIRSTGATGPKVSCRITSMSVVTSVMIVAG